MTSWADRHQGYVAPLVAHQPCLAFRIPLEGDLLTCETCGYWVEDHDDGTDPE